MVAFPRRPVVGRLVVVEVARSYPIGATRRANYFRPSRTFVDESSSETDEGRFSALSRAKDDR